MKAKLKLHTGKLYTGNSIIVHPGPNNTVVITVYSWQELFGGKETYVHPAGDLL